MDRHRVTDSSWHGLWGLLEQLASGDLNACSWCLQSDHPGTPQMPPPHSMHNRGMTPGPSGAPFGNGSLYDPPHNMQGAASPSQYGRAPPDGLPHGGAPWVSESHGGGGAYRGGGGHHSGGVEMPANDDPHRRGGSPASSPSSLCRAWRIRTAPAWEASAQRGGAPSSLTGLGDVVDNQHGPGRECRDSPSHVRGPGSPTRGLSGGSPSQRDLLLPPPPPPPPPPLALGQQGSHAQHGASAEQSSSIPPDRILTAHEMQEILRASRTSMHSLKGNKANASNQDRAVCMSLNDGAIQLYCVMDGHGECGQSASELCIEVMPKLLMRSLVRASTRYGGLGSFLGGPHGAHNPQEAGGATVEWRESVNAAFLETHSIVELMTATFLANHKGDERGPLADSSREDGRPQPRLPLMDGRANGTTATLVLLLDERWASIAHVGDSRAVLGTRRRGNPGAAWQVEILTRDHKPDLPEERARIDQSGAQVFPNGSGGPSCLRIYTPQQLWPMINMTRSLGDLHAHTQGVSAAAEVKIIEGLWDRSLDDAVLIIASDGVWDMVEDNEAIDLVAQKLNSQEDPAIALTLEAYDRWGRRGYQDGYSDDISAVVKFF